MDVHSKLQRALRGPKEMQEHFDAGQLAEKKLVELNDILQADEFVNTST